MLGAMTPTPTVTPPTVPAVRYRVASADVHAHLFSVILTIDRPAAHHVDPEQPHQHRVRR